VIIGTKTSARVAVAFAFDVRFTPESGHSLTRSGCLLWAKSGLPRCNKNII
jgi:hypothetical protein